MNPTAKFALFWAFERYKNQKKVKKIINFLIFIKKKRYPAHRRVDRLHRDTALLNSLSLLSNVVTALFLDQSESMFTRCHGDG